MRQEVTRTESGLTLTHITPSTSVVGMATLDVLADLLDRIEAAETQLDELAAVNALFFAVDTLRRNAIVAALAHFTAAEVGRATGGISKQAVSALARRTAKRTAT